jgi:hypothetical protein
MRATEMREIPDSDGCQDAGSNLAIGMLGFGCDVGFDTLFCVWPVGLL